MSAEMNAWLIDVTTQFDDFLYTYILVILLVFCAVYFTVRTRFVQIRYIKDMFTQLTEKRHVEGEKSISSFQAMMVSTASRVGTGNIAGIATAVATGGPGAIFWMWLMALLGAASAFVESTLAQIWKVRGKEGEFRGGPAYYIEQALGQRWLGIVFAVLLIICYAYGFNGLQAYNMASALEYYIPDYATNGTAVALGIVLMVMTAFVIFGGSKRISIISSILVPIMAVCYLVGALIVIFANVGAIPEAFRMIFVGAFTPEAVLGGAVGIGIQQAMRYGVARGLFSNEAGMGSTPHAHAMANVKRPEDQGHIAMVCVFIDTFVVLTLTALVVLTSDVFDVSDLAGVKANIGADALAQAAFSNVFGNVGNMFVAICLLFFAFSTIVGWYFFGQQNVKYLFGSKAVGVYSVIVVACIVVGSALKVDLVWNLSDFFNGLMALPNLIALLALSGVVVKIARGEDESSQLRK